MSGAAPRFQMPPGPETRAQETARRPPARTSAPPPIAALASNRAAPARDPRLPADHPAFLPDPEPGPRPAEMPAGHLHGESLMRVWGAVRREILPTSAEWIGPRDSKGLAQDLADAIDEDPVARAEVIPSMRLFMADALAGRLQDAAHSKLVLTKTTFGFACWRTAFGDGSLRDQLRGDVAMVVESATPDDDMPDLAARWRARS